MSEKANAHSIEVTSVHYSPDVQIYSVAFSPDGTKVVSASADGTIKVLDSGAPEPYTIAFLSPKPTLPAFLRTQPRWISRRRRLTRTAISSGLSPFRLMARRLCQDRTTGQSESGIVRSRFGSSPSSVHLLTTVLPSLAAATLELKSEKPSAHSKPVSSVQFSPNGALIVSGSWDLAIKVWDSGACCCQKRPFLLT